MPTEIEYAHESWNPIQDKRKGPQGRGYHCTKKSEACLNCWAEGMNRRFGNGHPFDSTQVAFEIVEHILERPLHWRKPRRIVVQFMGDMFHEDVQPELWIEVFNIMLKCPQHRFLLLTKRPERMKWALEEFVSLEDCDWIWPSITAENQRRFDERWAFLRQVRASICWLSLEPLLGPMVLPESFLGLRNRALCTVGGESGNKARPMHPDWVRKLRDDCKTAGIPFLFKQWGAYAPADHFPNLKKPGRIINLDGEPSGQVVKVGKKTAGRLLDGREWNGMPMWE